MRRNVLIVAVLACLALASGSWAAPFGRFGGQVGGGNGASGMMPLHGWALDADGIHSIDILVDGVVVGRAAYGRSRPAVLAQYPAFPNADGAGFAFMLDTTHFLNGLHTIQPRAKSVSGAVSFLNARTFQFLNNPHNLAPFGKIQFPQPHAQLFGRCNLASARHLSVIDGYALDVGVQEEDTGVGYVELMIDRALWANTQTDCEFSTPKGGLSDCYGLESFDVEREFPWLKDSPHSRFRFVIDVGELIGNGFYTEGSHLLTIRAGDHADQDANIAEFPVQFRCSENVANHGSVGEILYPFRGLLYGGDIDVAGWALDIEGVLAVDVYVDGVFVGQADYGLLSPGTVASRHPTVVGHANAGYSFILDTTTLSNGRHSIQVKVRDFLLYYAVIGEFDIRVGNPNGGV